MRKAFLIFAFLNAAFLFAGYAEKVSLKSGSQIQGKIVEQTGRYIRIEVGGVPIKYYLEDIESIDGVKPEHSASPDKKATHSQEARKHYLKGEEYVSTAKFKEALTEFKAAIKIDPNFSDAYTATGFVYIMLQNFREAATHLEKALTINPADIKACENLGVIHFYSGNYDKAIHYYEKAIKIDPRLVSAHNSLGSVYILLGKSKESIEHYQKALDADPYNAATYFNLGDVYYRIGQSDKAREYILKSKRLYELDQNFEGLQQAEEALKALNQ